MGVINNFDSTAINYIGDTSFRSSIPLLKVLVVDYPLHVTDKWHYHERKHAMAILKGGNQEIRNTKSTELTIGSTAFYHEGEKHLNRHVAYPSKSIIIEFEDSFFSTELSFNNLNSNPYVFPTFLKVFYESMFPKHDSIDSINQYLYNLLSNKTIDKMPSWLFKLKELIHDRWNQFIPLNDLSKELNVHPVTISKCFSKYYGYTISDYMRNLKVERAISLLLTSTDKISEIAHACGFSDQSHMARSFKQQLGFSPKMLRTL